MSKVDFFSHVIEKDDYITGNKFIEACEELDISFAKMDYVLEGFEDIANRLGDQVFVTHQSDNSLQYNLYENRPKNIKAWLSQNCEISPSNNVFGIPIGINNLTPVINKTSKWGKYSSSWGHICDFHQDLFIMNEKDKSFRNLCYMNFNPSNYLSERTHLYDKMKNMSWVTNKTSVSHSEFAEDAYHHPFILSPRGNGFDCVRTWESLYLRSIPIIKRCVAMEHFEDLPILLVDDWDQITESFLINKLDEIKIKNFDMSKAKMSYWKDLLRILKIRNLPR
jgi:hypothetical protein